MKYFVICLTGLVMLGFVNCSDNEFSQEDQTGNILNDGGTCNDERCTTRNFVLEAVNPADHKVTDILFVLDNSATMRDENQKLRNRMNGFIQDLNSNDIDYQICYVVNEPLIYEQGRVGLWSNNSRVLRRNTPNLNSVFLQTLDNIQNIEQSRDQPEQPIAASYSMIESGANTDCFRPNSAVNVVILTDEDENDVAIGGALGFRNQPNNLINIARNRLGEVPFMVHAIIPFEVFSCHATTEGNTRADTIARLAQTSGGIVGNICSEDYASQLSDISLRIQDTLDSIALGCNPINNLVSITSPNNINYSYTIDSGRLFLTPGIPADSSITVSYDCNVN